MNRRIVVAVDNTIYNYHTVYKQVIKSIEVAVPACCKISHDALSDELDQLRMIGVLAGDQICFRG